MQLTSKKLQSIRTKLLLSFLLLTLISILIASVYAILDHRKTILNREISLLNEALVQIHEGIQAGNYFLLYEKTNEDFYESGDNHFLEEQDEHLNRALRIMDTLLQKEKAEKMGIMADIKRIKATLNDYKERYATMTNLLRERGYKDYGEEGKLRYDIHMVENLIKDNEILMNELLMLRRAEKDYMLRNGSYVNEVEKYADRLKKQMAVSDMAVSDKKQVAAFLTDYLVRFQHIIHLDKIIGVKAHGGMSALMQQDQYKITNITQAIHSKAELMEEDIITETRYVMSYVFLLALLGSISLGYMMTMGLTEPIIELSNAMSKLTESNFSRAEMLPSGRGKDEIALLTDKYNVMVTNLQESMRLNEQYRHKLEEHNRELAQSRNELRDNNADKDKLFSIIAHDLKGPLHNLMGFLHILITYKDNIHSDEFVVFVKKMDESVKNILDMMNNLLNWSRMQADGLEPTYTVMDPDEVCMQSMKPLLGIAEEKEITVDISLTCEDDIEYDANVLSLCVRNLVNNAIKFTPKGGKVTVSSRKKNREYTVNVHDTGVGMKQDLLEKILNEKSYFSTVGTSNEKGTGLGLMLIKEYMHKTGGKLVGMSAEGEGTTFSIIIPTLRPMVSETQHLFFVSDRDED